MEASGASNVGDASDVSNAKWRTRTTEWETFWRKEEQTREKEANNTIRTAYRWWSNLSPWPFTDKAPPGVEPEADACYVTFRLNSLMHADTLDEIEKDATRNGCTVRRPSHGRSMTIYSLPLLAAKERATKNTDVDITDWIPPCQTREARETRERLRGGSRWYHVVLGPWCVDDISDRLTVVNVDLQAVREFRKQVQPLLEGAGYTVEMPGAPGRRDPERRGDGKVYEITVSKDVARERGGTTVDYRAVVGWTPTHLF